jgi:two-component system, NtrC family, sensor histidine kinase HydH
MKNKKNPAGTKPWMSIPPWLLVGAIIILVPILLFMTLDSILKQREHTIQVFLEKGDALIRSFEAGARTELTNGQWDFFRLQKLLMETAQQPDVDYLIITDDKGAILADSDPSLIGETYTAELDLARISRSNKIEWRRVANPDGVDTFEVFRRFSPAERPLPELSGRQPAGRKPPLAEEGERDEHRGSPQVIFVGLNMGPIEAARKEAVKHTILMALLLLFIGSSGMISLFFAQGYRSARHSLSRIKAFSAGLVENMPIGLAAIDGEGNVLSLNQAAEAALGLKAPEVVGKKGTESLPPELMEVIGRLGAGTPTVETEMDCTVAPGKIIPLEVIAALLKEGGGAFLGYILLFRDMTEVRRLKKEIARSRHLASLGSLAAGVAHEIRNPLSSIKGFATYFKERYRDVPEDGQTADIMVQEVERLNRVIGQLLEFARPVAMDRRPASMQAVIQHALKMIENDARGKNVTIRAELSAEVPELVIDADKIKQVLLNLCLNALEAMREGGTLTVSLVRNDRAVRLTVSDTGRGIDQKDLPHVFDPYFTTKPSGTGLGLAIVQKIIEAHDGEIRVASVPGTGTSVTVVLPVLPVNEKGETAP